MWCIMGIQGMLSALWVFKVYVVHYGYTSYVLCITDIQGMFSALWVFKVYVVHYGYTSYV